MKKKDYTATISVNASPEEAFKHINEVSRWWAKQVEGRSEKLNDVFTAVFNHCSFTFKIIGSEPGRKVEWLVTDSDLSWLKDKKEWNGTKISFEISQRNGFTEISFTHNGLVPNMECYDNCEYGWNLHFKQSLLSLITEGKGQPAY